MNLLIDLAPKLLESSVRYANQIAHWTNKVETRYKEFFNVLAKVQQANGLQMISSTSSSGMASMPSAVSPSPSSVSSSKSAVLAASPVVSYDQESKTRSTGPIETACADGQKKPPEILKQNEQKQKMIKKRQ